jgi:hypothetical protein
MSRVDEGSDSFVVALSAALNNPQQFFEKFHLSAAAFQTLFLDKSGRKMLETLLMLHLKHDFGKEGFTGHPLAPDERDRLIKGVLYSFTNTMPSDAKFELEQDLAALARFNPGTFKLFDYQDQVTRTSSHGEFARPYPITMKT